MIKNALLLFSRIVTKNKTGFIINLLGLSVAIGCAIVAFVNYEFNHDFDKLQTKAPFLYRVSSVYQFQGKETKYGLLPLPLAGLIKANNSEVNEVVRYLPTDAQFRIGDEIFQREISYTDQSFASVFNIEMVSGSLNLNEKSKIYISEKLAATYFGSENPLGKNLTQIIKGQPKEFEVGGVFKTFPFNSSFRFDMITNLSNYLQSETMMSDYENDWSKLITTFIYVTDDASISRIENSIQKFIKPQNDARPNLQFQRYYIEPFVHIGERAVKEQIEGNWINTPMPPAAVIAPFFMAGFLLLVACFNYTNNSIAIAGTRLKEIGIKKVMGSRKQDLVLQFIMEGFFFCTFAMLIGLVLAEFFVRGWDYMWPSIELSIVYKENITLLTQIGILLIFVSLLASSYPALLISRFNPVEILKGQKKFGGSNLATKILLVLQLTIALAAIIFALAFNFNARYQRNFDLGFSYNSVIEIPVENENAFTQLKNALQNEPAIKSLAGGQHHICTNSYNTLVKSGTKEIEAEAFNVGDDYFKTVNIRFVEGRDFQKYSAADAAESVVVNEEFMNKLGLTLSENGNRLVMNDTLSVYISGVVKDVYLQALFAPVKPLIFRYTNQENYKYLVISASPQNILTVNEQVKKNWKKLFPNSLYPGRLMEDEIRGELEHFDNAVILYSFLGSVAFLMSLSGLFSIISLQIQKNTKELGIRKILGAEFPSLILRNSRIFIVTLIISSLLGSILGGFMVNKLMDNIWEYYQAAGATVIGSGIAIVTIISAIVIFSKVMKSAYANPVNSLRSE